MNGLTDNLDTIAKCIRSTFIEKDSAREKVLPLCREVIRHCSNSIRAVHRREFDKAIELLQRAHDLINEVDQTANEHSELKNAGFLRDAQREFAEGSITLALTTGKQPPSPMELGINPAAYLNGLGEAVGELRRYLLDSIRRGDLSDGEALLSFMDDIYSILVTMDFPDAITGGLRHTTDMVRGILEKTRSDLTLAIRQKELESKIEKLKGDLS